MSSKVDRILKQWHARTDDLPEVPENLGAEIEELIRWKAWIGKLLTQRDQIIERLDRQWLEREEANARSRAISQRQAMEIERELEEKHLRKINSQIRYAYQYVDEVCDKILKEMRRRKKMATIYQQQVRERVAAMEQQRKAEADLKTWEAYIQRINGADDVQPTEAIDVEELARQAEEEARLQAEIEALKAKPTATDEENQATWEAFVQGLNSDQKKTKRG